MWKRHGFHTLKKVTTSVRICSPKTFFSMGSTSRQSLLYVTLLYLSLIGIGAIGGYAIFFLVFSDRCMSLLAESQRQNSECQKGFETKYKDALERHSECLATKAMAKRQWDELQGRVEVQATLASRYRNLLSKQQETHGRLTKAEASRDAAHALLSSLQNQIKEMQGSLNDLSQELNEKTSNYETREMELKQSIQTCENLLEIRTEQVEDTLRQLSDIRASQEVSSIQTSSLQSTISDMEGRLMEATQELEEASTALNIQEKDLQQKVKTYEQLLDMRMGDIDDITKKYEECNESLPSYRDELSLVKNYVQKLQLQQCKME
jgi:chromosome segregation ATPase